MVIKRDINFTPKNQMRTLHIYLPDDYDETDERYPVMYFWDGHNLFYDEDATYGKSWGLLEFMNSWEKKMIVVGIECSHEGNARLSEYYPYSGASGFLEGVVGMGEETMQFMIHELKPMIDREYRTYSFREATGIAGSSMGGLMSLYAVICHNDVFSKGGCLSSSIHPCMDQLEYELDTHSISPDTRVYLSWGEHESFGGITEDYNSRIAGRLTACNAAIRMYRQPDGHHCEADWEKQVPFFMDFLWLNR